MTHELSTSTNWAVGALPKDWIESLFELMSYTYGNKFADQWAGVEPEGMKLHWAVKLGGMTDEELIRGIATLETRNWPPTLPEFMRLCRPALDPAVAYLEAVTQGGRRERGEPDSWSCPAVFWAWKRIGHHDFTHLPYAMIKARWEAALAAELAVEQPEPIPEPMPALPAPGKASLPVQQARQMLSQLVRWTRQHGSETAADPKRWAREILARNERGEPLTLEQVKSAKHVLGVA